MPHRKNWQRVHQQRSSGRRRMVGASIWVRDCPNAWPRYTPQTSEWYVREKGTPH